jgi:transcriptional regulator with GAF, ATPase, and Fis domain
MSPSPDDDQTALSTRRALPRPVPVRIRVASCAATPQSFRLTGGTCVLGAAHGVDIVLSDSTVSRRHVELTLAPEGVSVSDLGSRNGTFYLGQRVERMTLALGSRFRVGSAEIWIEADEESFAETSAEDGEATEYEAIVGASPAMRQLFARLKRLEGSLVNVLVQGESGVGKELIAGAIHRGSLLSGAPFVVVNCGALAKELVASELFGHKRGAFTGAHEARRGAFERADGGTLFLDEIGELPLDVQPMLLRALESGEVQAVGDDQQKRVKVRVLAATNRSLADEVRAGRFREDLFYRLAVVTLSVPPLRERASDIPLLARRIARAEGVHELPTELLADLSSRPFAGNVRELKNAVLAFLALGDLPDPGLRVTSDQLESALRKVVDVSRPYAEQKDELAARFTRIYLEALLRKVSGNQTEAARLAGMDRGYLGRLVTKHGVGKG